MGVRRSHKPVLPRRKLIAAAFAPKCGEPIAAPTDEEKMNNFANEYNIYVEKLKSFGEIDLRQWRRVERAWEQLRKT